MSRLFLDLFIAGVLLHFLSCAKVGLPRPPLSDTPGAAGDLRLVQDIGEGTYLLFTLPDAVESVEILRNCEEQDQTSVLAPVARVDREELEPFHYGLTRVKDPDPRWGVACSYQIRFVGKGGRRSPDSNSARTEVTPVAEAPTRLRAEVSEDHIDLRWDPPVANSDGSTPANVVGYLVNSKHLVTDPLYVDEEFEFGRARTYRVQSVAKQSDPTILSAYSEPLMLVPHDLFPPGVPTHLDAVQVGNVVQLIWDPVESADLEGYFVYRRTGEGEFKKISPLLGVSRYLDKSPAGFSALFFRVTAVDKWGNESESSETVMARRSPSGADK